MSNEQIAREILDYLNFDCDLPDVQPDIEHIAAVVSRARVPSGGVGTDLGVDTPYPLSETLRLSVEWLQHLHDSHECDCHGWEQRSFLVEAARRYQREIATPALTSEPELPRIKEAMLDEIQDCDKCDLCEDHHV